MIEFLKKPRNIYFSIIAMLTLVTGLFSVSFSYYIDDSNNPNIFELSKVDNRIQSDALVDGYVTVPSQETIEIKVYVMSNNDFDSSFKLYYKTDLDVDVYSNASVNDVLAPHDVKEYTLSIANFETTEANVFIGIANGYVGKNIEIDGHEITLN